MFKQFIFKTMKEEKKKKSRQIPLFLAVALFRSESRIIETNY